MINVKLRSRQGAYRVEFDGPNGEKGSIWLSYLENAGTFIVRIEGEHGNGEIEVTDMIKRKV